jgi:hypothetical protein
VAVGDVAPCSLVEIERPIALIMEAVGTFDTPVNFYETAWRNIPEDRHLFIA